MSAKDELKNFNHVDLLFPSKYVKAADLRGKSVPVVIERIKPREKLMMAGGKSDMKPVIYLRGKEKGWILNKTNARAIAKVYGPELTEWIGKTVVVMATQVEAHGEMVDAIRVDLPATQKAARANGAASKQASEPEPEPPQEREPGWDDLEEPPVDEAELARQAREAEGQ